MKKLLVVLGLLFVSTAAHASIGCLSPDGGPCQNDASSYDVVSYCSTVDECFYSGYNGYTYTRCVRPMGCAWCDISYTNSTMSTCAIHPYSYGHCTCGNAQTVYNGYPRCTLQGSCNYQ